MMINALTVNVTDQKPYVEVNNSMVEDSENIYSVTFIFDEMWDGFAKTAIFQNTANKMIVMAYLDEEGKCELHPSVLKKGRLEIGVRGVKGDQVITTSASSPAVNIKENAIELDLSSESPSPFSQTLYDDLVARIEKKEEEGGGGVTDYNDLENKPCWTEKTIGEVLEETEFPWEQNTEEPITIFPTDTVPVLETGGNYTVTYNGVDYYCVAIDPESLGEGGSSMYSGLLGNVGGAMGGESTGEPFMIGMLIGQGIFVMIFDNPETVTISISGEIAKYHTLNENYLPPHIAKVPVINLVSLGFPTITEENQDHAIEFEDGAIFGELERAFNTGIVRFKVKLTITVNNVWMNGTNVSGTSTYTDEEVDIFAYAMERDSLYGYFVAKLNDKYIYFLYSSSRLVAKIKAY